MIFGRKELQENIILHDFANIYGLDSYLIGGEYRDNSSKIPKGFLVYYFPFYGLNDINYLFSTGNGDIVNKVLTYSYMNLGVGKSGTGSSASFFFIGVTNGFSPFVLRKIGVNTNVVDPNSEISKSLNYYEVIGFKEIPTLFTKIFVNFKNVIINIDILENKIYFIYLYSLRFIDLVSLA